MGGTTYIFIELVHFNKICCAASPETRNIMVLCMSTSGKTSAVESVFSLLSSSDIYYVTSSKLFNPPVPQYLS